MRKLQKQANTMQSYLEKHPNDKPLVWRPLGCRDKREWSWIEDRFGKIIAGRTTPLRMGECYEIASALVPWNGGEVKVFAKVLAQVSMDDARKLARRSDLHHKPHCYEIHVD